MIDRSTNIRAALRRRQRGFIINPFAFGSGGPPAPADPSELASLVAWWDADDSATITHSGGEVSAWNDKSGNGWHVAQGTGTRKPNNLTSANFGSKNVLEFDGGDWLEIGTATGFPLAGSTPVTLIAVFRQSANDAGSHDVFSYGFNSPGNLSMATIGAANGKSPIYRYGSTGTYDGTQAESTTAQIGVATIDTSKLISLYKDGTACGTNTPSGTLAISTDGRLCIGKTSYTSAASFLLTGEIAEIVVCDAVLSTGDRQAMEGYLAHKWGLAGNLPGGHPYKSSPP